jgi:hypothetical protein
MNELADRKGKKPMIDDTDGKIDIDTDEDDHAVSLKSDSDYEGIFVAFYLFLLCLKFYDDLSV